MASAIYKIKNSDLFFVLLFLILGLVPIPLKLALTGAIGPAFSFYYFILYIPALAISLAALRGWKEGFLTSVLLFGAILISLIGYPSDPIMDLRRQLLHQANVLIIAAALASIVLQVALRRRRTKSA